MCGNPKHGPVGNDAIVPVPFKMGFPSLGGPIVTAGGVGFLTSALDYYIRAYDVTTGNVLWRAPLPARGRTIPMTYPPPSGHQTGAPVAWGAGAPGTQKGGYLIADARPPR